MTSVIKFWNKNLVGKFRISFLRFFSEEFPFEKVLQVLRGHALILIGPLLRGDLHEELFDFGCFRNEFLGRRARSATL